MPEGHPAFALDLSGDGSVLAAWSQGTGEFVFFDQGKGQAPGRAEAAGMSLRTIAPLSGGAMLALSLDGQVLAAHDGRNGSGGVSNGKTARAPSSPQPLGCRPSRGSSSGCGPTMAGRCAGTCCAANRSAT